MSNPNPFLTPAVGHVKARTETPKGYPPRGDIPQSKTPWSVPFPDYKPTAYTAQAVLDNDSTKKAGGWADPPSPPDRSKLQSYTGALQFDAGGRPVNPMGRTGVNDRGLLGKWGPNFAADPIVTRANPETAEVEMLAIQRKDNGQWAIPGGMVDYGEAITATLSRELLEETAVSLDMRAGTLVYQGYVDDPRNTDNAWMETTVFHVHIEPSIAAKMKPKAGDDAAKVRWYALTPENVAKLYASHGDFVARILPAAGAREDEPAVPLIRNEGSRHLDHREGHDRQASAFRIAMPPTFLAVAGGRLAVSQRPRLRAFTALRDQGCTWVVSVLGRREEPLVLAESARVAGLGWLWLDLEHGRPPQGSALRKLWRQVHALCNLLASGESMLVHCSAGQHRTGMVTYMLLRLSGIERPDVVQLIERLRPATRQGLEQSAERFVEPEAPLDDAVRIDESALFAHVCPPDLGIALTGRPRPHQRSGLQ